MAFFSQWLDMLAGRTDLLLDRSLYSGQTAVFRNVGRFRHISNQPQRTGPMACSGYRNQFDSLSSSVGRDLGSAGFPHDELIEQLDELRGSLAPLNRGNRLHSSRARIDEIPYIMPTNPASLGGHHFLTALR